MQTKKWRDLRKNKKRHSLPDEEDGRLLSVEVEVGGELGAVLPLFWVVCAAVGSGGGGGGVGIGLLGGRGGGGGGCGGDTDSSVVPFSEVGAGPSVGSSNNTEP